jgi:membrane associated rhomboid family serine protease
MLARTCENALGHMRFLVCYLVCGVAAAALYIVTSLDPSIASLRASGATVGMLGGYLVLYSANTVRE